MPRPPSTRFTVEAMLSGRRLERGNVLRARHIWLRSLVVLLIGGVGPVVLASQAVAAGFTVNSTGDGSDEDTNDGICEVTNGTGDCTLRAAIQQANATSGPDVVTFSGSTTTVLGSSLPSITEDLTVTGNGPLSTIVDGNDTGRIVAVGPGVDLSLSQLKLLDGSASGDGGAILHQGDALTLTSVNLESNAATGNGGAIAKSAGTMTLNQVIAIGNSAAGDGGAVWTGGGSGTDAYNDVSFSTNQAGARGGALFLTGDATITNTVNPASANIDSNDSVGDGGASYVAGGDVTFSNILVTSNASSAGNGGGIAVGGSALDPASVTLQRGSSVPFNMAASGGGVFLATPHASFVLKASDVGANTATTGDGGNIYNLGGTITGTLDIVDLPNGVYWGKAPLGVGGGIASVGGSIALEKAFFEDNEVGSDGGAIHAQGTDVTLTNTEVRLHGSATPSDIPGSGAGIYIEPGTAPGSLTLQDVNFHDNAAQGQAGAVWSGVPTTITQTSVFQANSSTNDGGAIYHTDDLTIEDSSFTDNSAGPGAYGGAIHQAEDPDAGEDSHLSVTRSVFTSNETGNAAGAIAARGGSTTITDSTFDQNSTLGEGGAIEFEGYGDPAGPLLISDSTFSGNQAESGGALKLGGQAVVLDQLTLSGNRATDHAGAIYNGGAGTTLLNSTVTGNSAQVSNGAIEVVSGLTVKNSVFADNGVGSVGSLTPEGCASGGGQATSEGFNFDAEGTCITADSALSSDRRGSTATPLDPLLAPLADNGGSTKTQLPLAGSPLIDKGSTSGCPATDQRGFPRPRNGDGLGTARCDIGAVERPTKNPKLTIKAARVREGDGGTRRLVFKLVLSGVSEKTISSTLRTVNGTAKSPGDFRSKRQKVTFQAGQTSKSFVVLVKGDNRDERNETLFARPGSPVNVVLGGRGRGTIVDDD